MWIIFHKRIGRECPAGSDGQSVVLNLHVELRDYQNLQAIVFHAAKIEARIAGEASSGSPDGLNCVNQIGAWLISPGFIPTFVITHPLAKRERL